MQGDNISVLCLQLGSADAKGPKNQLMRVQFSEGKSGRYVFQTWHGHKRSGLWEVCEICWDSFTQYQTLSSQLSLVIYIKRHHLQLMFNNLRGSSNTILKKEEKQRLNLMNLSSPFTASKTLYCKMYCSHWVNLLITAIKEATYREQRSWCWVWANLCSTNLWNSVQSLIQLFFHWPSWKNEEKSASTTAAAIRNWNLETEWCLLKTEILNKQY